MKPSFLKSIFALAAGAAVIWIMFGVAFMAHREAAAGGFWLTTMIGICGVATGWLLGLIASPKGSLEASRFHAYAKVVAGIVSGYFLGKIDPLLTALFEKDALLHSHLLALRLLLFSGTAIISAITMFTYRSYLRAEAMSREGHAREPNPLGQT